MGTFRNETIKWLSIGLGVVVALYLLFVMIPMRRFLCIRKAYVRAACVLASRAGCTFSELSSREPMQDLRLSPGFFANADEAIE